MGPFQGKQVRCAPYVLMCLFYLYLCLCLSESHFTLCHQFCGVRDSSELNRHSHNRLCVILKRMRVA